MKLKCDVLKILRANPHDWCANDVAEAVTHIEGFPDGATLAEIAIGIKSAWAFAWASAFPEDRDLVRDQVTSSYYAFLWACRFSEDRDLVRDRVTNSNDALWWTILFKSDHYTMRGRITDARDALAWSVKYPEDKFYMHDICRQSVEENE